MKRSASIKKLITISSLSILLSMLTFIMGAPFILVLRKAFGPRVFWTFGLLATGAAWLLQAQPLAISMGSIWMTLGLYVEIEKKGVRWWISALLSLASGALFGATAGWQMLLSKGVNTLAELEKLVAQFTTKVQDMNPVVKLDPATLVQQTPSAIVIILILALGWGLIFERRVTSWLNLPIEGTASQLKLLEYRLPDFCIWVAMTAFLLTMVSFGGKATAILAVNIVNVMVVLYFFQGLAVLEVLLNTMKAGAFMRVLTYIIMVGQLLPLLSVVGLADFWLDFRGRMKKLRLSEDDPLK